MYRVPWAAGVALSFPVKPPAPYELLESPKAGGGGYGETRNDGSGAASGGSEGCECVTNVASVLLLLIAVMKRVKMALFRLVRAMTELVTMVRTPQVEAGTERVATPQN